MEFSAATTWVAAAISLGAIIAAFLFRNRPWSRTLAIIVTIICFQATFIILPPYSAVNPDDQSVDWNTVIANILGRIIFTGLIVSGVRGRWLWEKHRRKVPGPWNGSDDTAP